MSRSRKSYKSASKHRIPNEGELAVRFVTPEGHRCGMKVQIANVAQTLISTADLTKAGHRVALEEDGGTITNKATGRQIALERRGNIYILKMWVEDPKAPGFRRQGS